MPIAISSPLVQTEVFSLILVIVLLVSLRKSKSTTFFPPSVTQELKGAAMLMVLFAHIGYEIFNGSNFLFPLSTLGGVGVNVFFLLSGYGLTVSAMNHRASIKQFYQKRLIKLYVPLWLTLALLLVADFFVLHKTFPWPEIISAFFGFFPKANGYVNMNAPLWYFTAIIFYYLLFPILFSKKYPILSAIGIYLVTILMLRLPLPIDHDTVSLYHVHDTAFPIGMLLAALVTHKKQWVVRALEKIKKITILNVLLLAALGYGIWYTAIYSGVGHGLAKEQFIAMITTLMILFFFYLKNVEIGFLSVLGVFSYEIYLIHWPIIYDYGFLYHLLPAWIATVAYLGILIGLAFLLQKITGALFKKIRIFLPILLN